METDGLVGNGQLEHPSAPSPNTLRSSILSGDVSIDWFGNTTLHHCFANNVVHLDAVASLLADHPEYAQMKNQFGRLPLHYALDRIRVNPDGVLLLLRYYPEGVNEVDGEGQTPYDLAVRWKHSNAIKKMILEVNPSLDHVTYMKLKYGPLSNILLWMYQPNAIAARRNSSDHSLTDNLNTTACEDTEEVSSGNDSPMNSFNASRSGGGGGSSSSRRNTVHRTASWSDTLRSSLKNTASSMRRRSFTGSSSGNGQAGNTSRVYSIDQRAEDADGREVGLVVSDAVELFRAPSLSDDKEEEGEFGRTTTAATSTAKTGVQLNVSNDSEEKDEENAQSIDVQQLNL